MENAEDNRNASGLHQCPWLDCTNIHAKQTWTQTQTTAQTQTGRRRNRLVSKMVILYGTCTKN
eukprot:2497369-Lingulodinium_polyedra.AAC.1